MTFFYSFTESLRQKWLQFFQLNRDWIKLHMEVESVYTPDGGRRPPSYLILGVVNALEPKLAQLMQPFSKLNPDADTLIEVLELHFDPDIALGNHTQPYSADVISEDSLSDLMTNGHSKERELEMLDEHEQTLMVSHTTIRDEMNVITSSDITEKQVVKETHNSHDEVDAFGDISFDDLKEVDSKTTSETALDENGFGEVLSDVWSEGTATHKGEAHDIFAGEELPTGSFDESEIAHLFPNA